MRKFAFAVVLFLLAFAVPVTIYSLVSDEENFDTREQAAEESSSTTNASTPQIISVPVTQARAGVEYSYKIKAVDDDSTALEYLVQAKPEWLLWDADLYRLYGTPSESDVGSHEIEVSVSDGKWLDTQKFEINVESADGSSGYISDEDNQGTVSGVDDSSQDYDIPSSSEIYGESGSDEAYFQEEPDPEEYGVYTEASDSEVTAQDNIRVGSVLGESDTELPKAAVFKGVLGLGVALGIITVALFLWIDAKHGIMDKLFTNVSYSRGEQISMTASNGTVVKKRRVKI